MIYSSFLAMAMRFNMIKNNFKVVIMLYNFYSIILNISNNYVLMSQNIFLIGSKIKTIC